MSPTWEVPITADGGRASMGGLLSRCGLLQSQSAGADAAKPRVPLAEGGRQATHARFARGGGRGAIPPGPGPGPVRGCRPRHQPGLDGAEREQGRNAYRMAEGRPSCPRPLCVLLFCVLPKFVAFGGLYRRRGGGGLCHVPQAPACVQYTLHSAVFPAGPRASVPDPLGPGTCTQTHAQPLRFTGGAAARTVEQATRGASVTLDTILLTRPCLGEIAHHMDIGLAWDTIGRRCHSTLTLFQISLSLPLRQIGTTRHSVTETSPQHTGVLQDGYIAKQDIDLVRFGLLEPGARFFANLLNGPVSQLAPEKLPDGILRDLVHEHDAPPQLLVGR